MRIKVDVRAMIRTWNTTMATEGKLFVTLECRKERMSLRVGHVLGTLTKEHRNSTVFNLVMGVMARSKGEFVGVEPMHPLESNQSVPAFCFVNAKQLARDTGKVLSQGAIGWRKTENLAKGSFKEIKKISLSRDVETGGWILLRRSNPRKRDRVGLSSVLASMCVEFHRQTHAELFESC